MVKVTITPPRKKMPHPAQRIKVPSPELADGALPAEWFEEVRQRAIASGSQPHIACGAGAVG